MLVTQLNIVGDVDGTGIPTPALHVYRGALHCTPVPT